MRVNGKPPNVIFPNINVYLLATPIISIAIYGTAAHPTKPKKPIKY